MIVRSLRDLNGVDLGTIRAPSLACLRGIVAEKFPGRAVFFNSPRHSFCVCADGALRRYSESARSWHTVIAPSVAKAPR